MKKKRFKVAAMLAATIFISGCGISPYRQTFRFMFSSFGGYYNSRMDNGNYHVEYESGYPLFRNKEKVRDFALRRACELAMEKGFHGFKICNERGDATGWVLEIYLTSVKSKNTFDAKETLASIQKKYKHSK